MSQPATHHQRDTPKGGRLAVSKHRYESNKFGTKPSAVNNVLLLFLPTCRCSKGVSTGSTRPVQQSCPESLVATPQVGGRPWPMHTSPSFMSALMKPCCSPHMLWTLCSFAVAKTAASVSLKRAWCSREHLRSARVFGASQHIP